MGSVMVDVLSVQQGSKVLLVCWAFLLCFRTPSAWARAVFLLLSEDGRICVALLLLLSLGARKRL